MMILALEFSSSQRSVAVAHGGRTIAEVIETGAGFRPAPRIETASRGGGGTGAFRMIETALREAKIEREQIEMVAVGLGPGSYTGIRVALSMAQGWQLARGKELRGVNSMDCLAAQAQADGIVGRVNVIVDAQKNELYLATYEISVNGWNLTGSLRLIGGHEMEAPATEGTIVLGPEVTRWFGNGRTMFPRAGTAARLAAQGARFAGAAELEPIYLRETSFVRAPLPKPGRQKF